jgi:hypothetical protein
MMYTPVTCVANKAKVYYGLLKEPDLTMTLDEDDEDAEEEKPKVCIELNLT